MSRESTRRLLQMVDDGLLDPRQVLRDALNHMSENEVTDMAHANEYFDGDDDDDDDDGDDDTWAIDPEMEAKG